MNIWRIKSATLEILLAISQDDIVKKIRNMQVLY